MRLRLPGSRRQARGPSQVAKIQGFATTFEILQGYSPATNEIGFRVPVMPEGFEGADWFDTYYGSLSTVGDGSGRRPLQCGFPAGPPEVGDYLTVADDVPTPGRSQGYYYVTAVVSQGQTRWGRRLVDGILRGRNPDLLPNCPE